MPTPPHPSAPDPTLQSEPDVGGHRRAAPANKARRGVYHAVAVLHRWAESGWAGSAVGSWAALQGSVAPGPADALLVPLGVADPQRVFRLAAWAIAGATAGGLLAYAIGVYAYDEVGRPLLDLFGVSGNVLAMAERQFARHGWAFVALSAVSPISAKLVSIAAGAFGVPFWHFASALFGARAVRFLVVATIIRVAGHRLEARIRRVTGRPLEDLA